MAAAWMTDRAQLTEKLRTIDWRKLPRLAEGDAGVIAATAGLAEEAGDPDSELSGLVVAADAAINDVRDGKDCGADAEWMREYREIRDGAVEEFLSYVREALLPEVVAAEDAALEAELAKGLPGLGS